MRIQFSQHVSGCTIMPIFYIIAFKIIFISLDFFIGRNLKASPDRAPKRTGDPKLWESIFEDFQSKYRTEKDTEAQDE